MRRLGRRRWSIPVEAKGEAKCCNPADWSHRAMTASPPASLPPPPAGTALWRGPPPSYRAAAAALLCCIWPPMWRCDRLCGANFQDLLNNRFTHKIFHQNLYKENHITISNLWTTLKYSDLKLHYQNSKSIKIKKKIKTKSNSIKSQWSEWAVLTRRGKFEFKAEHESDYSRMWLKIHGICNSMKSDFNSKLLKLIPN